MINGNVNEFVDNLYYGTEMNFAYNDKQYFIQSWIEEGNFTLELCQTVPVTTVEGYCIWKNNSNNVQQCVNNFLNAKIFGKKSFWEIEQKIEWLYDFPIDGIEESKIYYTKHPEDINLPNSLKIELAPKKISEMDDDFKEFVKRMIIKTQFGTFNNSEFYNKSGEIMTSVEFLTWYYNYGFKYNEYDWKSTNYNSKQNNI